MKQTKKAGKKTFEKIKENTPSWSKHRDASSSLVVWGSRDKARSFTSLAIQQDDPLPLVPTGHILRMQSPNGTRYIESFRSSDALPTARIESVGIDDPDAVVSRASFDTNANFYPARKLVPRRLTYDISNREAMQQQRAERPSSQGKIDGAVEAYNGSDTIWGRLPAFLGYGMMNETTIVATRSGSPRNDATSAAPSLAPTRNFQSSALRTFLNTDMEEKRGTENAAELQTDGEASAPEVGVIGREAESYDGLEKTRLQNIVYERFCAEFEELRDETKNKHQHKVAQWVAEAAENLVRQDFENAQRVMTQMGSEMRSMRTQLDNAILQKNTLESTYRAELESERNKHAQDLKKMQDSFAADVKKQVGEKITQIHKNHQYELDKSKTNILALERQHKEAMSKKTEEMTKKDHTHRDEINKKDHVIASRDQDLERKQRIIESNRKEHTNRMNQKIHAMEEQEKEWQVVLQKERADRAEEKKYLQRKADAEKQEALAQREAQFVAARSSLIAKHEAETKALQADVEAIETEAEKMERGWKNRLEEQKRVLLEEKATEMEEAEQNHMIERDQLQLQLREQNKALLSRDDEEYNLRSVDKEGSAFPAKTDEAIESTFQEIQNLVDELSEMKWKADQRTWTPQVFQKIGRYEVERLLRKAILQDLTWTVLFHGVFRSPFRVFGAEGEALERQWAKSFAKDHHPYQEEKGSYNWPPPGIETERWRYMTVRECNQVLRSPVGSKYDPRAKLKKDYKGSYDELVGMLKAVLGDIVEIEDGNLAKIEKLARRTAAVWIDFEMHRCRIVVRLTGTKSHTTMEKALLAQRGSFALTVRPEIGRYGNVEGLDLDTFTVIDGCAGETLKIP